MRASAYIYIVIGLLLDIETETGFKIHKKRHLSPYAGRLIAIEVISETRVEINIKTTGETELETETDSSRELSSGYILTEVRI